MTAYEQGLDRAALRINSMQARWAVEAFLAEQPTHLWCTLHNLPSIPTGGPCADGVAYSTEIGVWRHDCPLVPARIVIEPEATR